MWCFGGDVQWYPRSLVLVWHDFSPSSSLVSPNVVQQTLSELKHAFSSAVEVCTAVLISLLNSLPEICLWLVYGGISTFLDAPSSAHWYIQKLRNMSTTTDSSVFCNTKVVMGLREVFAFTHHERLLLWDPGWSLFYKPSVRTESADIRLHWQGEGLLSKHRQISAGFLAFYVFLHLLFIICLTHVPRVIRLYYFMDLFILISLHVWIPWIVTDIWWKCPMDSLIKNIFTENKCWHIQYLFSSHMLRYQKKEKRLE